MVNQDSKPMKVLLFAVVVVELMKHLQFVRCQVVSVSKEYSHYTHQTSLVSNLLKKVKLEEIRFTIFVREVVKLLVLNKYFNSKKIINKVTKIDGQNPSIFYCKKFIILLWNKK